MEAASGRLQCSGGKVPPSAIASGGWITNSYTAILHEDDFFINQFSGLDCILRIVDGAPQQDFFKNLFASTLPLGDDLDQ